MEEYYHEEYTEPCPHQYILGGVCQGDGCGMYFYHTGLQDSNKQEIFEGMILKSIDNKEFRVYWDDWLTWCIQDTKDEDSIEWLSQEIASHLTII